LESRSEASADLRELLREFHDQTDSLIGPSFFYRGLPSEKRYETALNFRHGASDTWGLEGAAFQDTYELTERQETPSIQGAEIQISNRRFHPCGLGISLGGADSTAKDRLWGAARLQYDSQDNVFFDLNGSVNRVWKDFAEAVRSGAALDEVRSVLRLTPGERIALSAQWRLARIHAASGEEAGKIEFIPEIYYTIRHKPYFALGYQFVYDDVNGDEAFFSRIPLIGRSRTHYLGLSYSRSFFADKVQWSAFIYNGEDPGRNLRFVRGDLFGASLGFRWRLRPWLDARARYEHGRENASGLTGESHSVFFSLTGRWSQGNIHGKETVPD
jgi:hypothetical protein